VEFLKKASSEFLIGLTERTDCFRRFFSYGDSGSMVVLGGWALVMREEKVPLYVVAEADPS